MLLYGLQLTLMLALLAAPPASHALSFPEPECPGGAPQVVDSFQPLGASYRDSVLYCPLPDGTKHGPARFESIDYDDISRSRYTAGSYAQGARDGAWTTIDVAGNVVRECTYADGALTGGDASCGVSFLDLSGQAQGGIVSVVVGGQTVVVNTTAGQNLAQVSHSVALALSGAGVEARAVGGMIEATAPLESYATTDSGLTAGAGGSGSSGTGGAGTAAVPALSRVGIVLLAGILLAGTLVLRRRTA